MKLIFGQFTQAQLRAMQEEMTRAQHSRAMIVPYWGDHAVQVVEIPRKRCPRKRISIKAHTP